MEPLDTDVAIEAPEHIVFSYRVAGPARRTVAHLIDLTVCYGALFVFANAVLVVVGGAGAVSGAMSRASGLSVGLILLAAFAAQWIYFALWEGATGRTPGKAALRLRVLTTTGRPIHGVEAALRNILRAADALPNAYVTGLVCMALTRRFQRLGDVVAGTMVVMDPGALPSPSPALSPPATETEIASLPDQVVLDADERSAILLFLRRRGALGREREGELASMIATTLHDRFGCRGSDPVRTLALVYDAAVNRGRSEASPSARGPIPLGRPHAQLAPTPSGAPPEERGLL